MLTLNIQLFKIGMQAIKMEMAAFIILLQKEVYVVAKIQKFHGHKWRPVQQLHGNTQVVF